MTSPSPSTGTKQTAAAATKECRTLIEQNPPVWAVNLFITSHCGPSPSKSPVGTRRALHGGFCHSRVYSLLSSSTLADSSSSRSLQSKTCSMQAVRPRSEAVGQRTTKRTAAACGNSSLFFLFQPCFLHKRMVSGTKGQGTLKMSTAKYIENLSHLTHLCWPCWGKLRELGKLASVGRSCGSRRSIGPSDFPSAPCGPRRMMVKALQADIHPSRHPSIHPSIH